MRAAIAPPRQGRVVRRVVLDVGRHDMQAVEACGFPRGDNRRRAFAHLRKIACGAGGVDADLRFQAVLLEEQAALADGHRVRTLGDLRERHAGACHQVLADDHVVAREFAQAESGSRRGHVVNRSRGHVEDRKHADVAGAGSDGREGFVEPREGDRARSRARTARKPREQNAPGAPGTPPCPDSWRSSRRGLPVAGRARHRSFSATRKASSSAWSALSRGSQWVW